MAGVRIMHPTLRGVTLLIEHPGDGVRRAKDYHLRLDSEGQVTVSETVWARIREAEVAGQWEERFVLVGEVLNPPPLSLASPGGLIEVGRFYRQEKGRRGALRDATTEQINEIKRAINASAPRGVRGRVEERRIDVSRQNGGEV